MLKLEEKMNHILPGRLLYTDASETAGAMHTPWNVTGNVGERQIDRRSFGEAAEGGGQDFL